MKNTNFTCSHLGRFPAGFIFLIASVSYIVNANAQLSWGVNGAGGDGVWDSATPNWFDGTNNVPWVNGGSAAFGGVAGTVSISGSVTASEVAFGVSGYVLESGSLTSAPGGLTIRTDANATINSAISRPNGSIVAFTKTGTATLRTFNALSTFSRVAVEEGELHLTGSFSNPVVSLASSGGATLTLGDVGTFTFSIGGLFGGGIVQPGAGTGAQVLSVYGAGGTFGGSIRNNTGATLGLYKSGMGVQRLTGVNTYTGRTDIVSGTLALAEGGMALNTAVTVNGGTLLLDNSAVSIADRLSDSAPVTMFGGSIVFQGHALSPATETVGSLVLGNNPVSIAVNPPASQPASLTFASLSPRVVGRKGLVTFTGAMLGQPTGSGVASIFFQTPPPLVGGSDLHPEARIVPGAFGIGASGKTFVTYGANGIRPLADEDYANDLSRISHWENADVSTAQTIRPDSTVNSLRLRGNASITGNEYLSLRTGIILTQPGEARIAVHTLDFGTSEMLIANDGNLTITGRVTGTNRTLGFTKTGAGRLVLAGPTEFVGSIDVFQGVLRLQNATSTGTSRDIVSVAIGAAIELAGGVSLTQQSWSFFGNGPDGRGALRNVSGNNSIGSVQTKSTIIDVVSGNLTVTGNLSTFNLKKTGTGSLTVTGSVSNTQGIVVAGGGILASTRNTGSPFVGSGIILDGSALRFAPTTLSPQASVALSVPGTFTFKGGASTLAIDRGTNAGVTVTFASAFTRTSPATLLIAPAGGLATLGTVETIKLASGITFPQVNGIVTPSIIAQDTDANRSGDFLSYTAATGLKRATFSTSTNLTTAGNAAVFNATTPQTLTANATIYALKNSGQTIDLAGRTLTVGGVDQPSSGIILNGGSITGGTLRLSGNSTHSIYTNLAGGQIASAITTSGTYGIGTLAKFGPGKLILSGNTAANVVVESGTLQLDRAPSGASASLTGDVNTVPGATLAGIGAIGGAIRGGLISPGVGTGILRADRIGRLDTKLYSFDSSFDVSSFAFEFTRLDSPIFGEPGTTGNDVLRLSSPTRPFESSLIATDEMALYFAASGGVRPGDTFRGGFFTDRNASFLDQIDDAKFRYFVSDGEGGTVFNDRRYSERTDLPFEIATVPQTANFGGGNVNGYIMEVRIVPEPSALLLLLAASLALWSGSMSGRAAHGSKFPRTEKA